MTFEQLHKKYKEMQASQKELIECLVDLVFLAEPSALIYPPAEEILKKAKKICKIYKK